MRTLAIGCVAINLLAGGCGVAPHGPLYLNPSASVDQRDGIAWLSLPGAFGAGIDTVEGIDTHSLSSFSSVTACSS